MLMRRFAADLRPGAYLLGASPSATEVNYGELERLLGRLIESIHTP
jgi:hypothetical protein